MLKIALTGGIGSGKSAVGELLQELGATVIDSDELARAVIERGSVGFEKVVAEFGDEILTSGEINRARLAEMVFADQDLRLKLEAIIHPLVREATAQLIRSLPADAIVVNEIPLLFETQGSSKFDFVIAVQAQEKIRIERLKQRGMKEYEITKRMSAQASDAQRASISHAVLQNNGSIEDLREQVQALWSNEILTRANSR